MLSIIGKKRLGRFFSNIYQSQADNTVEPVDQTMQFSKAPIMKNFGELQPGEIPEPLKYGREMKMTTVSNGIRVCTEKWPSPISSVGVFINAGSRNETLETSGSAHFLEHLMFKRTKNRSRYELETGVENLGMQLNAYTTREYTLFHTESFNKDIPKAVNVLGDMVCNSLFDRYSIEWERETIRQELEHVNEDLLETLMENVYFNIYREHMMG